MNDTGGGPQTYIVPGGGLKEILRCMSKYSADYLDTPQNHSNTLNRSRRSYTHLAADTAQILVRHGPIPRRG